jgi:predicted AlkP superfamily phosphohydrolase/phosphomutase
MENSVWGNLKSCEYFFTSPAWKCYSTGKNPGKLGAVGWCSFDRKDKRISLVTSKSFKSKELWDILGEHDLKCGVINMPLTFPPRKINGVMITGPPHSDEGCTFPPELEKEIKKDGYIVNSHFNMALDSDQALQELPDLITERFRLGKKLLERSNFDFFQVVIFHTDSVQHYFWKQMEKRDSKNGTAIEDCWKLVDLGMADLLDSLKEDCCTFIISDHGATPCKGAFRLNIWLSLNGYLSLKPRSLRSVIDHARIMIGFPYDMKFPLNLLGKMFMKFSKAFFSATQLRLAREKNLNTHTQFVQWKKTKAISVNNNSVYMTTEEFNTKAKNKLVQDLKNLRNPKSGEKVVRDVRKKEEIFEGKYLDLLPDLIIIPEDGYDFVAEPFVGTTRELWDFSRKRWSGTHRIDGILMVHGPGIKRGERIDQATIYDVAPTILHLLDFPIPNDVDGRVLKEIFEENSELANKSVIYEKEERVWEEEKEEQSLSDQEKVVERLRKLGYM